MKYIVETLGIEAYVEQWDGISKLPYYLIDRYIFKKAELDGISCLFLKPKGELETINAIKKHIKIIHEIELIPVVLDLDSIIAWRRKSFIGARIPFVVADSQIYLPFLGIALTERYTTKTQYNEILMPSSQLVFFYYLYQGKTELYTNGLADSFNLSAMQISRSIKQLQTLGLISVRKDGVKTVIYSKVNHRELFKIAKPHLLNPVQKHFYAEFSAIPSGLPLSGLCALSELTMLNPPVEKTFALYDKTVKLTGTDTLIDSYIQVEIEIWRYAPALLSDRSNIVDTLSLITSIKSTDDERIEQAVEEALNNMWE